MERYGHTVFSQILQQDGIIIKVQANSAFGFDLDNIWIYYPIVQVSGAEEVYCILAHIGSTTIEYKRRFFDLDGKPSTPTIFNSMHMLDDGLYNLHLESGFTPSVNPWEYPYGEVLDFDDSIYQNSGIGGTIATNGLGVVETAMGTDIKFPTNDVAYRFMLNQTPELEVCSGLSTTVIGGTILQTLYARHSCLIAPYGYKNMNCFLNRYTSDSIVSTYPYFSESSGVLGWYKINGETYGDVISSVDKIYITKFQDKSVHDYIQLYTVAFPTAHDGIIVQQSNGKSAKYHKVIDATLIDDDPRIITEPIQERAWDLTDVVLPYTFETGTIQSRSATGATAWWLRNGWITPTWPEHGNPNYISNFVKLPFALSGNSALSYVSIEKKTASEPSPDTKHSWKTDIYVEGRNITNNSFQDIDVLYSDHLAFIGDAFSGLLPTWADERPLPITYNILHSQMEDNFKLVFYRKFTYLPELRTDDFIPYRFYTDLTPEPFNDGLYHKLRQVTHYSRVEHYIYCNGRHTKLSPYFIQKDSEFLISPEVDTDITHPQVNGAYDAVMAGYWIDIDLEVDPVNHIPSQQIARIFSSTAGKYMLIGYDIFPVSMRHKFINSVPDNVALGITYDETYNSIAFPPWIDSSYTTPTRVWTLCDKGGNLKDIQAPTDNRVNGLGLFVKGENAGCIVCNAQGGG